MTAIRQALRRMALLGIGAASLTAIHASRADAALVQNGGFETMTNGPNAFPGWGISDPVGWNFFNNGQVGCCTAVFAAGAADTVGAAIPGSRGYLWGPNNGSNNGLPAASPAGGNFLSMDSDPAYSSALMQTINGLIPSQTYLLSFNYAAGQYKGFTGATQSAWHVSLGNQTQDTPTLSIAARVSGSMPGELLQS